MALLVLAYSGLSHLKGFPFYTPPHYMLEYWPSVLANLFFSISCSAATFVIFDRARRITKWDRISVRSLFILVTFFALVLSAGINFSHIDQFFADHGLIRRSALMGLPLKFFVFIGIVSFILVVADGIVLFCETLFFSLTARID